MTVILPSALSLDFNPLPPCGGRPCSRLSGKTARPISIHSLRVEGDGSAKRTPERSHTRFQSTPSVWRETTHGSGYQTPCAISIHSLRVEGDKMPPAQCRHRRHFNPLPPCGGRRTQQRDRRRRCVISIHSLRVEGDCEADKGVRKQSRFQSTPSVWRETDTRLRRQVHSTNFNPLPPCGGRP